MMMKKLVPILFFYFGFMISAVLAQPEAEQTISEFNLAGFGERGKKNWELSGKSADVFEQNVKLKDIVGKLYSEEEVTITAEQGNFDKSKGNVQLQDNVIITTEKGAKLTTDSLSWDRNNQVIYTKDQVNIQRDNIIAEALGAFGQPDLKKVNLEKEVKVHINPASGESKGPATKDKITITCDGPLEVDYEKNIAVFHDNVKVDQKDIQIYSDSMDVYFVMEHKEGSPESEGVTEVMGGQISRVVAKGNVKIVRGENVSYSDQAVYNGADKRLVLTGSPRLIIYSEGKFDASVGD